MTGTVLVLGASGRFGRHAAEAFWNRGWSVRVFDRLQDDLNAAALGVDVIVNGWNPPYERWATDLPDLTRRVIDAARISGATVVVPGNVYVFGPDAPEVFSETTPHLATNALGRLRIEMETAYRTSGVQTILLRAGDFLDTEPSGNWFDRVMVAGLNKAVFTYPGNPDIPHAWAYLPDLAAAAVRLAERRSDMPRFEDVPFPGLTLTGRELSRHCAWRLGRPVRLKRMNWLPLRVASPVCPLARNLREIRYLWDKPHRLDGTKLEKWLPEFSKTDPDVSIARTLDHKIHPDKAVAEPRAVIAA